MRENIVNIAATRLCNTCGACFSVCPANAVHYQETVGGYYLPVINEEKCIHCGLCYDVCPGVNFGKTLFSKIPVDPFAGAAESAFVGKATNQRLFANSQSGGIASALLVNAIESGMIKGAVTVTMQAGRPPRPAVKIAETLEEIFQAQKSKYCPVPLLCFLKEMKKHKGPVAVVGTPCHIHGLINILDKMPKLQSKIAFTIGLVCDRILTHAALDYLVAKAFHSSESNYVSLHFRDKSVSGYPGDVHVFSGNGLSVDSPARIRIQIKDYFTPARCRICFDKMNIFSDISIGDPHGLEGVDRKQGESVIVLRTKRGKEILRAAKTSGAVDIRPVQYDQILEGQKINQKKAEWHGFALAWEQSGRQSPNFFNVIRDVALPVADVPEYKKKLEYALNLDNFSSRDALIRFVSKRVRRQRAMQGLLFPMRLGRWFARKIIR